MSLLHPLPIFSHSLCYPQSNWTFLVLLPEWVGLCTFQNPVGLSNELSCEDGNFSHFYINPHRCFNQWFEALFPYTGTLGCAVCCWVYQLLPCCQLQLCPPRSTIHHLAGSTSLCLATSLLHPGCLSLPLLPVWMKVSSLSPWLSGFHTVRFSVSSGCFLFLNCCCPSFGCARRHSVSTYASILAGSHQYSISEKSYDEGSMEYYGCTKEEHYWKPKYGFIQERILKLTSEQSVSLIKLITQGYPTCSPPCI